MKTPKARKEKVVALRIEGDLTIYQAAELKHTLMEALELATSMVIDLSAVSEVDAAGIQLLLLTKKTAQARQKEVRLVEHSAAVLEALDLLDLIPYFGDQVVIPFRSEKAASEAVQ